MWTLGREREKESARSFLGAKSDPALLEAVIDAVHDLLADHSPTEAVIETFRRGFTKGKSGTWESTGSWLIKAGKEFPELPQLWDEFAVHPLMVVRFRVACFIDDLPGETSKRILPLLLEDPSAKVRERAFPAQ